MKAIFKKAFVSSIPLALGLTAQGAAIYHIDAGGPLVDANSTTFNFTITDSFDITDLNLRLALSHEELSSVTVSLRAPDNTVVELLRDIYTLSPGRFQDMVLDDEASTSIDEANSPDGIYGGSYRPAGGALLSAFDGKNIQGTWSLIVVDEFEAGTGALYKNGDTSAPWTPVEGTALIIEPVPEPGTMILLGLGSFGVMMARRRKE